MSLITDGNKGEIIVTESGRVWKVRKKAIKDEHLFGKIDAKNLASGIISNAEFERLNGVTGNIQTQLDAKAENVDLDDYVESTTEINGHPLSSDVLLTKEDIGLGNVANIAPADLPISSATQAALNTKLPTGSTTAVIASSVDKRYVSDAQLVIIQNTSGVNTGDKTLAQLGGVPDSRTINGQALTGNITLTTGDIPDAVPETRTINGYPLDDDVVLVKADIGLGNVDNTSDLNKGISTATQTALDLKVTKNAAIVPGTHTQIQFDAKGLVTGGSDATTADIDPSTDRNYLLDIELEDVQSLQEIITFELVSKNLKGYQGVLAFTGDTLNTITYDIGGGSIVKTLGYVGDKLTTITLSGNTPSGISLVKTLNYTGDLLTSWNYS